MNPNPAKKAVNLDSNPNPDSDSHITDADLWAIGINYFKKFILLGERVHHTRYRSIKPANKGKQGVNVNFIYDM